MLKVGVIGVGVMGLTHLDVYARRSDARIVAVADLIADRRSGKSRSAGTMAAQAADAINFADLKQYAEGMELIADPDVDVVDICLVTPLHYEYAAAALRAGKHVLIEKPLTRTSAEAYALADIAEQAEGIAMCAMCMRFWPAWSWLKEQIGAETYGKVLSASFRRTAQHPGGAFYTDGEASGGAALDLHIHDSDFVQFCFGMPHTVSSVGRRSVTSSLDHIVTQYHYADGGPIVVAEGGWAMAPGFGFRMQYTVNFQRATASFDMAASEQLTLYETGRAPRGIAVEPGTGYDHEISYFLECIKHHRRPQRVTLRDAARSVALVEAEVQSADEPARESIPWSGSESRPAAASGVVAMKEVQ